MDWKSNVKGGRVFSLMGWEDIFDQDIDMENYDMIGNQFMVLSLYEMTRQPSR